jgi:integrase/recombinase XerD
MATDFAVSLRRFLTDHMAGLRGCSPNTISSYRDTFKLLIGYLRDERQVPPERLTLELIDVAAITGFLAWLRADRHNSPSTSTCNQRLAAISSFFAWTQSQDPVSATIVGSWRRMSRTLRSAISWTRAAVS